MKYLFVAINSNNQLVSLRVEEDKFCVSRELIKSNPFLLICNACKINEQEERVGPIIKIKESNSIIVKQCPAEFELINSLS